MRVRLWPVLGRRRFRSVANTLVRWGIAVGSVAAGTTLCWLVFLIADDADLPVSTVRLLLALVVVAVFAWWIRRLSLDDSRD